jgi:hypothetical protein
VYADFSSLVEHREETATFILKISKVDEDYVLTGTDLGAKEEASLI